MHNLPRMRLASETLVLHVYVTTIQQRVCIVVIAPIVLRDIITVIIIAIGRLLPSRAERLAIFRYHHVLDVSFHLRSTLMHCTLFNVLRITRALHKIKFHQSNELILFFIWRHLRDATFYVSSDDLEADPDTEY